MIRVHDLRKSYGSLLAVDSVSFAVEPGTIYGLLGPNGAGKTTTISCISGLIRPDGGRVLVGEHDLAGEPVQVKRLLGVVPQETAIYGDFTAAENVSFFGSLHGLAGAELRRRTDEVLEMVGLDARSRQQSRKFSGGMKRRLNLAIGLVHAPRALLLDEPTVGIDPQARIRILEIVRTIQRGGTAILYTTHYLEEAEDLCDRVGIMDHGRILAEGSIDELRAMVGEGTVMSLRGSFAADLVRSAVGGDAQAKILTLEDNVAMLSVGGPRKAAAELLSTVLRTGAEVSEISITEPSLQSLFLKLTGRELRD